MSSRPQLNPQQVIPSPQGNPVNSGAMGGNLISAPTIIQKVSMISYAVSWTGTSPVGTISVQVSNDFFLNEDGTVRNPGTWTTMTLNYNGMPTTAIPVSGSTGNGFIDVDQTAAYAIRLIYTAASGTGNLVAIVNGKVS